jgi:NADH-quinone oxidoreductase subunit M
MASLGLPGLAGFWGEFPAILSSYSPANGLSDELWRTFMVIAALGTVFAAGYLLWLLQRVAFGTPKPAIDDEGHEHAHEHVHDIHVSEGIAWAPLLVLIVVLGIFPGILFKPTDKAVNAQLDQHPCLVAESGPDCADLADEQSAEREQSDQSEQGN